MRLVIIKLKLGGSYLVGSWKKECMFIKTSPKGYNFLDMETYKCQLRTCLYIHKNKETDLDGYDTFLISTNTKIWELNSKKIKSL